MHQSLELHDGVRERLHKLMHEMHDVQQHVVPDDRLTRLRHHVDHLTETDSRVHVILKKRKKGGRE